MNSIQHQLFQFRGKNKSGNSIAFQPQPSSSGAAEQTAALISKKIKNAKGWILNLPHAVKTIGVSASMDDYEKRKLGIFNQLNFFQLITGICIPLAAMLTNKKSSDPAWVIGILPVIVSLVVLWLNAKRKYDIGLIFYFIGYPVVTSIVYISGINLGVELFFILYGVLCVFYLQQISHILFSLALSMISYFMLAVVCKNYRFQLESSSLFLYLFNQFAGIVFIFYGLFLIKKENAGYQNRILYKNREIAEKAALLEQQTEELTELNSVKNKLFSVIAHDLKTPMYALRNLFNNMQQQDLPATEIKSMLPDVVEGLNYTTGLMENLLQWAKSQMQSGGIYPQALDITKMIDDTIRLLQLQAEAKQLRIENCTRNEVLIMADKDMIDLVLRNLLSNAIKFTPEEGQITIGVNEISSAAEIFVTDNGDGICAEDLEKIHRSDYFTTIGTANEPGTGLGLMLCKEFIKKNGGQLFIESEPGKGSTFSFSLPVAV